MSYTCLMCESKLDNMYSKNAVLQLFCTLPVRGWIWLVSLIESESWERGGGWSKFSSIIISWFLSCNCLYHWNLDFFQIWISNSQMKPSNYYCTKKHAYCTCLFDWSLSQSKSQSLEPEQFNVSVLEMEPLKNERLQTGLEKTRVFLKKPNPVGFFGFFWAFSGFFGFFRVFLGFFRLYHFSSLIMQKNNKNNDKNRHNE